MFTIRYSGLGRPLQTMERPALCAQAPCFIVFARSHSEVLIQVAIEQQIVRSFEIHAPKLQKKLRFTINYFEKLLKFIIAVFVLQR